MKRMFAAMVVLINLLYASMAFAHGGAEHVMGTVATVSAATFEVKNKAGETKQIMFDDKTTFTQSGKKIKASNLKEGDRVVVDVHEMEGMLHASSVRVGVSKTKAAMKKNAAHKH